MVSSVSPAYLGRGNAVNGSRYSSLAKTHERVFGGIFLFLCQFSFPITNGLKRFGSYSITPFSTVSACFFLAVHSVLHIDEKYRINVMLRTRYRYSETACWRARLK